MRYQKWKGRGLYLAVVLVLVVMSFLLATAPAQARTTVAVVAASLLVEQGGIIPALKGGGYYSDPVTPNLEQAPSCLLALATLGQNLKPTIQATIIRPDDPFGLDTPTCKETTTGLPSELGLCPSPWPKKPTVASAALHSSSRSRASKIGGKAVAS